jgi:hypothetical protein
LRRPAGGRDQSSGLYRFRTRAARLAPQRGYTALSRTSFLGDLAEGHRHEVSNRRRHHEQDDTSLLLRNPGIVLLFLASLHGFLGDLPKQDVVVAGERKWISREEVLRTVEA